VSVQRNPPGPKLPAPEVAEILASVPQLAAYFRRASVEMPDEVRAIFDAHRRLLGTFAMYYRQPALPEPEHISLIEMATHIAAIAISRAMHIRR